MPRVGSAALTSREVRVGVAYAYVQLCRALGAKWLERNYTHLLSHFSAFLTLPALAKAGFSYSGPSSPLLPFLFTEYKFTFILIFTYLCAYLYSTVYVLPYDRDI